MGNFKIIIFLFGIVPIITSSIAFFMLALRDLAAVALLGWITFAATPTIIKSYTDVRGHISLPSYLLNPQVKLYLLCDMELDVHGWWVLPN